MEFATLAAFLIVAMVLCLVERGIRAHMAGRSGQTMPSRSHPVCWLASTVKLLARRPSPIVAALSIRGRSYPPGSALFPAAGALALATLPFGRGVQMLPSGAGLLVALVALAIPVFAHLLVDARKADTPRVEAVAAARRSVVVLLGVGLLALAVVSVSGTVDFARLVTAQQSFVAWFAWRQPLGLALAVLLILTLERPGPALSAGGDGGRCFSGILERVFLSALVVSLYLGGWSPGLTLPDGPWWTFLSLLVFVVKTLLVLYGIIALGRLLPRPRPDQAERLGWTMILPCAAANLLLTGVVVTLYQSFVSGPAQPATP